MYKLASAALCLAVLTVPAASWHYDQNGQQYPKGSPGGGATYPANVAPAPKVPAGPRYEQSGATSPKNGDLEATRQGDATSCCGGSVGNANSVPATVPTGNHVGSAQGSGGAPDAYFCLTSHDGWPLNAASSNQCKFKSTELKMSYCTCGSYAYYETYYVTMPDFNKTNSYDVARDYQCRGYDGYRTVYSTCPDGFSTCTSTEGYCSY